MLFILNFLSLSAQCHQGAVQFYFTEGSCWTYAQRDLGALGPYQSAHINFLLSVGFARLAGTEGPLCA